MDSRLINVVYDDPFDGNYVKYDNGTEFWSSGSEAMGMQLTETLNGILPIAPIDDFHKDDHLNTITIQNKANVFNYENFAGQHLASGGSIEIVTVNPNTVGYDTDSENEEDSDDDDDNDLIEFELQSQCSNATFRTRTDSSSIGDYESHTSDYDDSDDDNADQEIDNNNVNASLMADSRTFMPTNANNSILDLHSNLGTDGVLFDSYLNNRTLSTNTLNSDVDGFGLQIDANNFDLAEFITKDDFQLLNAVNVSNSVQQMPRSIIENTPSVVQVAKSKNYDSDSDSDVIVDVETIESDEVEVCTLRKASEICKTPLTQQLKTEEDLSFVDNIKTDPMWSPTSNVRKIESDKIEEKPIPKQNFNRNFPLVPNKKQCDLLKGKFAKGKIKSVQKSTKITTCKNKKIENSPVKQQTSVTAVSNSVAEQDNSVRMTGIGMGGKNLSLLNHEPVTMSEQSSEDNTSPIKIEIGSPNLQKIIIVSPQKKFEETLAKKTPAAKRKLNLDEYKKRRGEPIIFANNNLSTNTKVLSYKVSKLENKTSSSQTNNDKNSVVKTSPVKHSETVTSIVKILKAQQTLNDKIDSDPITEAKKKVLRLQELKKAQQMRILDSPISVQLPKVTKLLPLREIVKDTPYLNEKQNKTSNSKSTNSDYEVIIIISASCNTDISIPPIINADIQPVNSASRSLLKSSALLSTISHTFQKVKERDHSKLSNSSLIASIQDVVVKKTLPLEINIACDDIKDANKPEHHGEDKIIMHLRKDRIRKRMCSIGIQTDLQPEFPPLPMSKTSIQPKLRERSRRQYRRQYRKRNRTSSCSSSESLDEHSDHSNLSTISRSRDNSCSSSFERAQTYDSAIGTGGYSSRSSLKHRSSISSSYSESADRVARGRRQRRTSYSKRSAARKRSRSPYSSSSYTSDSYRSHNPIYRRSRSRSNSRTRSRSRRCSYRQNQNKSKHFVDRNVFLPAVEERRIVYVGRIEQETTKDMLRQKFLQYGTVRQISIHYKDTGMKYGFVTFESSQDAFAAIDNSTRDPQINMYDVSFGGRRAFCRSTYADLDSAGINTYQSYVFPQPVQQPREDDTFEALLTKMRAKLNANKTKPSPSTATTNGSLSNATNVELSSSNKI